MSAIIVREISKVVLLCCGGQICAAVPCSGPLAMGFITALASNTVLDVPFDVGVLAWPPVSFTKFSLHSHDAWMTFMRVMKKPFLQTGRHDDAGRFSADSRFLLSIHVVECRMPSL